MGRLDFSLPWLLNIILSVSLFTVPPHTKHPILFRDMKNANLQHNFCIQIVPGTKLKMVSGQKKHDTTLNLVPGTKCVLQNTGTKKRHHHPSRGWYPTQWPAPPAQENGQKPLYWLFGSFKNAFFWLLNDSAWPGNVVKWLKTFSTTTICNIKLIRSTNLKISQ